MSVVLAALFELNLKLKNQWKFWLWSILELWLVVSTLLMESHLVVYLGSGGFSGCGFENCG